MVSPGTVRLVENEKTWIARMRIVRWSSQVRGRANGKLTWKMFEKRVLPGSDTGFLWICTLMVY